MLESTKQLISTLLTSVVSFLKGVQVPGMNFSFLTLIIGVFLFAMLASFLLAFFGFGHNFSASELGGLTRDKVTASRKARESQAAEDAKTAYVIRRTRESNADRRKYGK